MEEIFHSKDLMFSYGGLHVEIAVSLIIVVYVKEEMKERNPV